MTLERAIRACKQINDELNRKEERITYTDEGSYVGTIAKIVERDELYSAIKDEVHCADCGRIFDKWYAYLFVTDNTTYLICDTCVDTYRKEPLVAGGEG